MYTIGFTINLINETIFKNTNFSYAVIIDVKTPKGNETARFIVASINNTLTVFISSTVSPLANKLYAKKESINPITSVISPIKL